MELNKVDGKTGEIDFVANFPNKVVVILRYVRELGDKSSFSSFAITATFYFFSI